MKTLKELRKPAFIRSHERHKAGTPILDIRSLSVQYDGTPALENINLRLNTGEKVAVIGPNGAGKSTLFKVVAGVLPATQGEVNIYGHGPGGHICIAYVPQRSQVDWNFPVNVADVVMMGRAGKLGLLRWPKSSDWDFVHQCLQIVGLEGLAQRQISELSGGQQQRMFIARALAQEAELMLMDEPFTGLDPRSQEDILHILEDLRGRGVTLMASTHDLQLASEHFERVILLNRRIMGMGHPEEVFSREKLIQAYGGHLRLIDGEGETLALSDTCCDEGEEHEQPA
ncbi:MAG: metal ABC transporter ATP-binding protein [Anaerolineales bacterium]